MGESYRVTTVGMAPAEDRAKRMRFYYMAMGLRMLCVASLFFVRGWWIAVALLGAVFLPYFAVMIANAVAANPDEAVDAPEPLGITGAEPVDGSRAAAADSAESADAKAGRLIVVDAPSFERAARGSDASRAASPDAGAGVVPDVDAAPDSGAGYPRPAAESSAAESFAAENSAAKSPAADSDGPAR